VRRIKGGGRRERLSSGIRGPVMGLLLGMVMCPLLGAAAPLRAAGSQDEVLARLARNAAGIETLQGRVLQEKRLEMFKDTVSSQGRFAYRRPDRLRWELTAPVVTGFVLTGSSGRRWHGTTGKKESFTLESDPMMRVLAGQILASVRADFSPLLKEYRISVASESPVTLLLEPLTPNAFVERVTVTFSKKTEYVESVAVREQGGDQTTFSFTEVEVNRPLPDDTF
jgi:outer membrane lipoprotein-sorting protein